MPDFIDLRPGQPLRVLRTGDPGDSQYASAVRHVSPEVMRIDPPQRDGEVMPLHPDDDVMLALHINGRMYTFVSTVQAIEAAPQASVIVDRPRLVEQGDRREFFRLPVSIQPSHAAILDSEGNEDVLLEATILDVSAGGVQLRSKQPIEAGQRIRLVFSLDEDSPEVDVTVVARSVMLALSSLADGRRTHYRVNTRFEGAPRAVQERIVKFVFRRQLTFLKKGVR